MHRREICVYNNDNILKIRGSQAKTKPGNTKMSYEQVVRDEGDDVMDYERMKMRVGVSSQGPTRKARKAGMVRPGRPSLPPKKDHWPRPGDTSPPQNHLNAK